MNFILDAWNAVAGSNLAEPGFMISALFFVLFIVLPIITIYLGFKIAIWLLTAIRDWWHDGRK